MVVVGQLEHSRRSTLKLPTPDGVEILLYPDCLDQSAKEIAFWRGSGNAPLWVLYSSGTSKLCWSVVAFRSPYCAAGKPKAIIHSQLGMIFTMKLAFLHNIFQLEPSEVHLQATNTGWMMYNQMVNSLCLGMTIILYDGNPILRGNKSILFDLVDRYK